MDEKLRKNCGVQSTAQCRKSLIQNTYYKNRQNVSRETFYYNFSIFNIYQNLFSQVLHDVGILKSKSKDLPISK